MHPCNLMVPPPEIKVEQSLASAHSIRGNTHSWQTVNLQTASQWVYNSRHRQLVQNGGL